MREGVGDKVVEASIRSREALEARQVEGKISDLQNQKNKAIVEVGNTVYSMYLGKAFDQEAITKQCEAITALDAQIKEQQEELEQVHKKADEMVAIQTREEAAATKAVCPQCGTALQGAPKFCPSCGKQLS